MEAQKGQQICCNDASVLLKKMMSNRQVRFWLGRSWFETSRLLLSNFSESNPMAEESEFADGALGDAFVQHSDWDSWWWDGCLLLAKSVTAKIPVDLCNGTIVLAYKSLRWWMYTLLVGSASFAGRLFEDPFAQVCLKRFSCYNPFLFAMACLTAYPCCYRVAMSSNPGTQCWVLVPVQRNNKLPCTYWMQWNFVVPKTLAVPW